MKKPWNHLIESDIERRKKERALKADGDKETKKSFLKNLIRAGEWGLPDRIWNRVAGDLHAPLRRIGFYVSWHSPSGPPARVAAAPNSWYQNASVIIRDLAPDKVNGYGDKVVSLRVHLPNEAGAIAGQQYLYHVDEAYPLANSYLARADLPNIAKVVHKLLPGTPRRLTRYAESLDLVKYGRPR